MKHIFQEIDAAHSIENIVTHNVATINNLCAKDDNLKLINLNIRSINKNFDELLILLDSFQTKYDIIVLTECWLNETYNPKKLAGYNNFETKINRNQNDGVVAYIKDS